MSTLPLVAVGGIGGSGTRVVAALLESIGVFMGQDRNVSRDSLWYTFMFKRESILNADEREFARCVRLFITGLAGLGSSFDSEDRRYLEGLACKRPQHSGEWLRERLARALTGSPPEGVIHWGWKEPNTHIVADRLLAALPNLKYIHLIRNPARMVVSPNQKQLRLWGQYILGRRLDPSDVDACAPRNALEYWCTSTRRILALRSRHPQRVTICRYEDCVAAPGDWLRTAAAFLGIRGTGFMVEAAIDKMSILPAAACAPLPELSIPEADAAILDEFGYGTTPARSRSGG